MTNQQFLQQFGHFIEAPNGIQKLRELILTLAVQGKLLPPDSNDEPASVLLENIEAEKNRLIKESKISKGKGQPTITEEEFYFPPPMNWKWAHLDDISQYIQRGKGPTYAENSDFPVVSQKCIQWAGFDIAKARFLEPSALEKYQDERFLQEGDLLWNSTGTGTIGRINVFPKSEVPFDKVVADSHVTVVRLLLMNPRFVWIWIASPYIQATIEGDASGSTNQVELATSKVKWQPTPIPPLPEQHRIVAKVDELMALCDQLEAERNAREATHQRLIRAVHHPLTEATDAKATQLPWHRIRDNFADLYTSLDSVQALRQTILQLAVQGKLVEQDISDEGSSFLLEKIKKAKTTAITKKVYGKLKPLPSEEIIDPAYQLPDTWRWSLLDDITYTVHYGYTASADHNKKDVRLLRITDIQNNRVDWESVPGCEITDKNYQGNALRDNDILIARTGGTIGKTYIVENLSVKAVFASYLIRAVPCEHMSPRYLKIFMETPLYWGQLYAKSAGTGQPNVNATSLRALQVPIPPAAEQHRIVKKVDELMTLCDQLETNIRNKNDTAARYAEAIVQQIAAA